jgi:hypothetical protein
VFFGLDAGLSGFNFAADDDITAGGTFNIGGETDLSVQNLSLAYGGSIGCWVTKDVSDYSYDEDWKFGIIGPFVRLRLHNVELLYRGLFGFGDGVYTNHLMIGYYFRTHRQR